MPVCAERSNTPYLASTTFPASCTAFIKRSSSLSFFEGSGNVISNPTVAAFPSVSFSKTSACTSLAQGHCPISRKL
jgi:hypothetical protein